MPLSDRIFVEQLKKTVYVRESRLTLYTSEHPDGSRFRVRKGIELVGGVSKTEYSKKKIDIVPHDPVVQGLQTRLENSVKDSKIVDHGHTGQDGHESDESRGAHGAGEHDHP